MVLLKRIFVRSTSDASGKSYSGALQKEETLPADKHQTLQRLSILLSVTYTSRIIQTLPTLCTKCETGESSTNYIVLPAVTFRTLRFV